MNYRISLLSIAMATIVLVSMSAVAGVSAAHASTVGGRMYGGFGATVGLSGDIWLVAQGAATSAGNIYYKDQSTATSWTGPIGTGTNPCILDTGTSMDVFWVSSSGALVGTTTTDGTTWKSITLPSTSVAAGTGPTAVSNTAGTTDVFYVDSATRHLMEDTLASPGLVVTSTDLGGKVFATPAATYVNPIATSGQIVVVVKGTGGVIYEKMYQMGGFSGWTKLHDGTIGNGAALVITPATSAAAGSRIYLFVAGSNGHLYSLLSTDGGLSWAPFNNGLITTRNLNWLNLGGVCASAPVAIAAGPILYVGTLGGDGGLWYETGAAPYTATTNWFWSTTSIAGP